jgi:hypothetical protein
MKQIAAAIRAGAKRLSEASVQRSGENFVCRIRHSDYSRCGKTLKTGSFPLPSSPAAATPVLPDSSA